MEMARMEYAYAYDTVGLNPADLTPPDIKRRFAAPLNINKSFPTPAQTDQDYELMLVNLINAHKLGGTVAAIEAVIEALTGDTIPVIELWRLVGNGVYDISDINTLLITIPLVGADPLSAVANASRVAVISQSLYAAIDSIKPAHIGIDFAVSVGSSDTIGVGWTDSYLPHYILNEPSPLLPTFTQSPLIDPTSPITDLAPYGVVADVFYSAAILDSDFLNTVPLSLQFMFTLDTVSDTWVLNPAYASYVLLMQSVSGVETPTGISVAPVDQGILAPRINRTWMIASDSVLIYEL
jgi:hypothetical protein